PPLMITLTHRHIGTVTLDAVLEETHHAELRITENPVESGAMIGDHAVLMPQTVTIAGIVVDYQPQRSPAPAAEEHGAEPLRVLTDRVPFPTDLMPFTAQALRVAQRELSSVIGHATAPQSDGQPAVRPLADWLPDYQP
ncbi:phage baseplate protein, partial [Xylella fastidiosa]|uniref:phage baseplate protein n=1 Tax=Xylella fastidiosa TaxID=2371 RepID=UPI000A895398